MFLSQIEPAHAIMDLSHRQPATSKGSGKPAHPQVLPEPLLFAHMKYGSR